MFIKPAQILQEVKDDLALGDNRKDYIILKHILSGVRELALSGQSVPKAVMLPINENIKTVNLPEDFVDWLSVGIVCGGEVQKFIQAKSFAKALWKDDCGNEIIKASEDCCDKSNRHFENFFGKFDVDIANGRIRLNPNITEEHLYLEYISNGLEPDGDILIREAAASTLVAYVHYQLNRLPRSTPDLPEKKQEYERQLRRLNRINNPISLTDIATIIDKNRTMLIK